MAVGEDISFNVNLIAHGAFRWKSPAIHIGSNRFNDDAPSSV
jgi:hypothetical protein